MWSVFLDTAADSNIFIGFAMVAMSGLWVGSALATGNLPAILITVVLMVVLSVSAVIMVLRLVSMKLQGAWLKGYIACLEHQDFEASNPYQWEESKPWTEDEWR